MAWIESHQDIREHPKTYALMSRLSIGKRDAVGLVHLLWWWAMDNALTGEIRQPNVAVARAIEWEGDANDVVAALVECGWLESVGGVLVIHDWHHRAGAIVEKRLQRKALKEKEADKRRTPNGRRTADKRLTNGAENRPTVSVSVSESVTQSLPKTKELAPNGGAALIPEIIKPETPMQILIRGWKIQSGVDPDDKAWDQAHYKRHLRPAQSLLNLFSGDVDAALDCIEHVYRQLVEQKGLDLSLQGVVNNSGRFRQEWQERNSRKGENFGLLR